MRLAFQRWPRPTPDANPLPPGRIVFLHGMGGTGALWRPIAAGLEGDYQILALDQRGHGGSQIARTPGGRDTHFVGYTPLDYGKDVVETLESEGFHPTWVVGHSMGVRTACAVAHLRPDWVHGLVLVDLGFFGPAGGGLGRGLATFLKVLPHRFDSREAARQFMTENCPDPSIAQYLMAVSTRDSNGAVTFPFDHSALIETVHAAATVSVRTWVEEMGRRKMPVLVLRGATSGVWSRAEYDEERQRFAQYPSIVFREFEGAGHGLPFEQRARFVAELQEFFGEARKPPG